ncbi:hypothetical protein BX600DRAFT_416074 [Xylariales sp. PMI_506]|nr:hypothetical protein BX600DRAFT_416074 [Xylariales sp. PMI_506]
MVRGFAKDQPEGFTNRIEKVAIVGAGGKMGKHITEQLLQTGKHTITAIARPDSTSQLPEGIEVIRVDYSSDDNTALVDALRGQQALVVTMAVTAPRDTVAKFIRAAGRAGVPWVFPNWFGQDPQNADLCRDTMLDGMLQGVSAELDKLDNEDVPPPSMLYLACNFWYEFSLGGGPNRYGFDFQKRSLVIFDGGDVAINTSTWPQCGRAIASLLSLKELPEDADDKSPTLSQFRNAPVYVSSFLLSQREMFASVKRVTGTTDADWTITHESAEKRWSDAQEALRRHDFSVFTRMLYSRTFYAGGGGDFESSKGLHNRLLGLPVEDLDMATAIGIRMGENGEVAYSH